MPKDNRSNIKIKRSTHEELNRYVRELAVRMDRKVTLDEAILHAIRSKKVLKHYASGS